LTVAALRGDRFAVALIPTTLELTTLGLRAPGEHVNIEVDVVAKYVEKLTSPYVTRFTADNGENKDRLWASQVASRTRTFRRSMSRVSTVLSPIFMPAGRSSWSTTRTVRTRGI